MVVIGGLELSVWDNVYKKVWDGDVVDEEGV